MYEDTAALLILNWNIKACNGTISILLIHVILPHEEASEIIMLLF